MGDGRPDGPRVVVLPGDGVVARFPGILCVARCPDPAPVARLLQTCRDAAGPEPGRALARRLAMWLGGTDAPPDSLEFGTLAAAGDVTAVFLFGSAEAQVGQTRLCGADSAAWTDRLLPSVDGPARVVLRGADGHGGPLAALQDLRAGVVSGAGADVLTTPGLDAPRPSAPAPAAVNAEPTLTRLDAVVSAETPPAATPPVEITPSVQVGPGVAGDESTGPIPPAPPSVVGGGTGPKAAEARGRLCAHGHLNDPRSSVCVLCGARMNEHTDELVTGTRPPLGVLLFDDGTAYPVDVEYLLGRLPDSDERVRAGALRPIVVEDRSGAVSRVHAEVRVDGWDVVLVDSGSRNGTFVAVPGDPAWTSVPPGRSRRLTPGMRVRLGVRTFVLEPPPAVR